MKFGVRECANIVFRAKQPIRIGTATFQAGQPVLYIDTATTSSLEQSTTTVYAQGGRGNARLLAWEGEKTLTFSFTDALLSPIGFAILSGAGLFKRGDGINSTKESEKNEDLVHFHMTSGANLTINGTTGTIDLRDAIAEFGSAASVCIDDAPVYIMETEDDGSLTGRIYAGTVTVSGAAVLNIANITLDGVAATKNAAVMVDYYIDLPGKHVYEADITPETFGGNYYVEADTLFRDQYTGKDLPANLTFPNVRLQSNFTLTFAGTGDPSTFDFTMDAFPGYTYFDRKKKVLAVMQIVDTLALGASLAATSDADPVMYHDDIQQEKAAFLNDSRYTQDEAGYDVVTFKAIKDAGDNEGDSENHHEIRLVNLNDSVSLKDRLIILDESGDDISESVKPKYQIVTASGNNTGNANGEITLGADGYVVAKVASPSDKFVTVIATVESKSGSSTQTKTVYFDIYVEIPVG